MSGSFLEHDWFPRPLPVNVVLEEGCWLHSSYALVHYHSRQDGGLRIGRHSGIYVETFFDVGPEGRVEIGDYCTLAGPILSTNGRITIGDHVLISREAVIADRFNSLPFAEVRAKTAAADAGAARTGEASSSLSVIRIGSDSWIGTRAVVLGGAQLGRGVIVGAGAVVDFEVPDYAIVAGNPAQVVGWARPAGASGA